MKKNKCIVIFKGLKTSKEVTAEFYAKNEKDYKKQIAKAKYICEKQDNEPFTVYHVTQKKFCPYLFKKEEIKQQAQEWQHNFENYCNDWLDVATWAEHWRKLGKRYGLLTEFKENGII